MELVTSHPIKAFLAEIGHYRVADNKERVKERRSLSYNILPPLLDRRGGYRG
jgi:hypothetical protein